MIFRVARCPIEVMMLLATLFVAAGWLSSPGLGKESPPPPECSFDAKTGANQDPVKSSNISVISVIGQVVSSVSVLEAHGVHLA